MLLVQLHKIEWKVGECRKAKGREGPESSSGVELGGTKKTML